MKEIRIDLRDPQQNDPAEGRRCAELCFKLSQAMPYTDEYESLVKELFCGNIGEGSRVMPGIKVVRGNSVKIGKNVVIMYNCLMMAAGTITRIMGPKEIKVKEHAAQILGQDIFSIIEPPQ